MRSDAVRNRRRIVSAARDLVGADGIEVRMDDLAARAGVAVGTLYRHFPTKSDLVDAVVAESTEELAELAERALERSASGDTSTALERFFGALTGGYSARRAAERASGLLGMPGRDGITPRGPADAAAARAVAALRRVVAAAQGSGEMRDDVDLADIFMMLVHAPERDASGMRERYFGIVAAGLHGPRSTRAVKPLRPDGHLEGSG